MSTSDADPFSRIGVRLPVLSRIAVSTHGRRAGRGLMLRHVCTFRGPPCRLALGPGHRCCARIHAAKTGPFSPWAYIILMIPLFGALAYVLVELLPEWLGSVPGRRRRASASSRPLNPRSAIARSPTSSTSPTPSRIARRLPTNASSSANSTRRSAHYDDDHAPAARRRAGATCWAVPAPSSASGRSADAVATLDELRAPLARLPVGRRPSALRPRAGGERPHRRGDRGVPGARRTTIRAPRRGCATACCSTRLGREAEARAVLDRRAQADRRAPRHARKVQAEWIAMAERRCAAERLRIPRHCEAAAAAKQSPRRSVIAAADIRPASR